MIPAVFVRHKASVPPSEKLLIRYGVNISLGVCILPVCEGFIKDLVFPHIEIENHDDEDDAVIEPLARDVNVKRFASAAWNLNIKRV